MKDFPMTSDNSEIEDDFDDQPPFDAKAELDDEEDIEYVSKTQVKRELQALRDLGKAMLDMSDAKLAKLPISDRVKEAVKQGRSFKMKALKRQIQHLGVLLRDEDVEAIRAALETETQQQQRQNRVFHQLENWRDALVAGDKDTLNDVIAAYHELDRQYLMQLIRNAGKEKAQNKPPKSSRALFAYLRELHEQKNGS